MKQSSPEFQEVAQKSTDALIYCWIFVVIGVPMTTCLTGIALRFVAFLFGM